MIVKLALALAFSLLTTGALAAPSLRGDVTVNKAIVTIGDIFNDAGMLAETGIFLAPAPGTTGIVPLADVGRAAALAGLTDFDNAGYTRIRVTRGASTVDAELLGSLIEADLAAQGLLPAGVSADVRFAVADLNLKAEDVPQPATLTDLDYRAGGRNFTARFDVAGIDLPLEVSGSIELTAMAPRLIASKAAGVVLTAADFEMTAVPLTTLDAGSYADLDHLVGQQLVRQARAGLMLKASDVRVPSVVTRNTLVTVILRAGAMTLTVTGTALTTAAPGEAVDVLNLVTKKVLHGFARADGTVEIPPTLSVAGL